MITSRLGGAAILLGVNIDHVATVRQARRAAFPDPLLAAQVAEQAGADSITLHLREDRRHIQDADVERFVSGVRTHINFEMAAIPEMVAIAQRLRPSDVCLVPERRQEVTTEGGLDVLGAKDRLADTIAQLKSTGSRVSLFIDPDFKQIEAAREVGAPVIELHTGAYAEVNGAAQTHELSRLVNAARYATELGLVVNAGHGLDYHNVSAVAAIADIQELNIGFSIIARALFTGMHAAVSEMKQLMVAAR